MSFKTIKYFKQSEENSLMVVALDGWQVKAIKDPIIDRRMINSVTVKILGSSHQFSMRNFITSIIQECDYIADLTNAPMPIAIRAIQDNVYVIERPPFKTSIRLTPSRASAVKKEASVLCDVWIPWTISVLTMPDAKNSIPSLKLFYNDGPLSSLDDIVTTAWTPNFHHNGDICLGQTTSKFIDAVSENVINPKNVNEVYNFLINDYFNGGWNLDLGGGIIRTVCYRSVGKFTDNPLEDLTLAPRIANAKLDVRNLKNLRSRESTMIKNAYLVWSLMDLSEVLDAVQKCRKLGIASDRLSKLLSQCKDKSQLNEKDSITLLLRSLYLSNPNSTTIGVDWSININFSKESILDNLIKHNEIDPTDLIDEYRTTFYNSNICERAAYKIIEENEELLLSFMKSSLDIIANNILQGSTQSQKIESNFDDIVKEKEYCNSILEEKS